MIQRNSKNINTNLNKAKNIDLQKTVILESVTNVTHTEIQPKRHFKIDTNSI